MEVTESELASLLLALESPTHDPQTTNSHVGTVIGTGPSPVEAPAGVVGGYSTLSSSLDAPVLATNVHTAPVKGVPVSWFSSLSGSALQSDARGVIVMAPTVSAALISASNKQARLGGTTICPRNP